MTNRNFQLNLPALEATGRMVAGEKLAFLTDSPPCNTLSN